MQCVLLNRRAIDHAGVEELPREPFDLEKREAEHIDRCRERGAFVLGKPGE
jgi:hypothetical protein